MSERLPAALEVGAIMRQVEGDGGFATILHRGDAERGTISLLVMRRGEAVALLERRMAADFTYRWAKVPSPAVENPSAWREWVADLSRIDPDCWIVELDVADAERFIAETTAMG